MLANRHTQIHILNNCPVFSHLSQWKAARFHLQACSLDKRATTRLRERGREECARKQIATDWTVTRFKDKRPVCYDRPPSLTNKSRRLVVTTCACCSSLKVWRAFQLQLGSLHSQGCGKTNGFSLHFWRACRCVAKARLFSPCQMLVCETLCPQGP